MEIVTFIILGVILLVGIAGAFYLAHLQWRGPYKAVAVLQVEVLSTTCTGGHIEAETVTRTIFLMQTRRGHRKVKGFHQGDSVNPTNSYFPFELWLVGGDLPAGAWRI